MKIYLWRGFFLLIIMLIIVTFLVNNLYDKTKETMISNLNNIVILDAGHGSPDGGAQGESGILEKDINLAITKKLQFELVKKGFTVIMTRTGDDGIQKSGKSISEKKRSDMNERVKIMNTTGADAFISIHMNIFTQKQYKGAQVFYSPNNEDSKEIAKIIQEGLAKDVDNSNKRQIKKADKSIFLLCKAKIPACLVECGFLSNDEEEKLLLSSSYQNKLAKAIAQAIDEYFKNRKVTQ